MIDLHSTPVIVAVVVGLIALSAIAGYLFAVARSTGEDAHGESTGGETATTGESALDAAARGIGARSSTSVRR